MENTQDFVCETAYRDKMTRFFEEREFITRGDATAPPRRDASSSKFPITLFKIHVILSFCHDRS
jgi:hypothetical protein